MRIPQDIISRLNQLDCEELAIFMGLEVKRHKTKCLSNTDSEPSLSFKGVHWHCFSCGKGGGAIDLFMAVKGVSFMDACIELSKMYGISLPQTNFRRKHLPKPISLNKQASNKTEEIPQKTFDVEIAQFILDHCSIDEAGERFLYRERNFSDIVVRKMNLRSISDTRPLFQLLKSEFGIERIKACNLLSDTGHALKLVYPLLFIPYYNLDCQLIGLQTRRLNEDRGSKYMMICNSHKNLYNLPILPTLQKDCKLFLMEGITDCLAALSDGLNAVAIQSVTTIPDHQLHLLKDFNIYMIPDADSAGSGGFSSIMDKMLDFGIMINRVSLPKDCNDYCDYHQKYV